MQQTLGPYRRVVVKIGSALLVDRGRGELRRTWVESLADDVRLLRERGTDVLLVSSGSIALGRGVLGFATGPLALERSQAAAAVGQIALARTYAEILGARGIIAGQVLLTVGDTEQRRRYLNARATIKTLIEAGAVPVINENDTVATSEIKYGDNDRLAARVAAMMSADLLVLLSDIDGLYTAPPNDDPDARHIPLVERITPEIEAMAGAAGSELSRGGMKTKIEAGKMATAAGCSMVIGTGRLLHPLRAIDDGGKATWFRAHETPMTAWKAWIVGAIDTHGQITVDAGAARALRSGKSLLPAGVTRVEGQFHRGDAVSVCDEAGGLVARGLIAYDSDDAERIAGHNSGEIAELLGYEGRTEMIHRDELALL